MIACWFWADGRWQDAVYRVGAAARKFVPARPLKVHRLVCQNAIEAVVVEYSEYGTQTRYLGRGERQRFWSSLARLQHSLECDLPGGAFSCQQAHPETRGQGSQDYRVQDIGLLIEELSKLTPPADLVL